MSSSTRVSRIQTVDKDIVESGKSMHETALALSILDIVVEKCREAGGHTVDTVRLRIGNGGRGHARSAELCLRRRQGLVRGGACGTGHRTVPVSGLCSDCKKEFTVQDVQYVFSCPLCNSKFIELRPAARWRSSIWRSTDESEGRHAHPGSQ